MEREIPRSFGFKKAEIVYFKTRFGIHTFFMKFEIDVLILDSSNRVAVIHTLKPNRIFMWNLHYNKVLELPQGAISSEKIKLHDLIRLVKVS